MVPVDKIYFSASWSPSIENLNPALKSLSQKIDSFFKKIILFIPNSLVKPIIRFFVYPSSSFLFYAAVSIYRCVYSKNLFYFDMEKQSVIQQHGYSAQAIEATTPDQVKLRGHFLKHPQHDGNPNARVLLCFHGNGDFYQSSTSNWLRELLASNKDVPYSFLLFNPRGVASSQRAGSDEDTLKIDAESMYQFAVEGLKIPESRLDLYGHSLGGGQAANLKALHPSTGGRVFLDRTFASLDMMVSMVFMNARPWIRDLARRLVKYCGWEFDNYRAVNQIKDPVVVFSHASDCSIPKSCSLAQSIIQNGLKDAQAPVRILEFGGGNGVAHMDPLTGFAKQDGVEPVLNAFNVSCGKVRVHCDVGFGNALYIRGQGAEHLHWSKGVLMKNVDANTWEHDFQSADISKLEFKYLINDSLWETGRNRTNSAKQLDPCFA